MEQNGLPISTVCSPANQHDSTKFVDIIESISDYLDDESIREIAQCYADKGYDTKEIRRYLESRDIAACIPHRRIGNDSTRVTSYKKCNRIRYVVEWFFSWLKNGFHRTAIRYERSIGSYLGLVNVGCIMMYLCVLR